MNFLFLLILSVCLINLQLAGCDIKLGSIPNSNPSRTEII